MPRGWARGVACIAGPPLCGAECREHPVYKGYCACSQLLRNGKQVVLVWLVGFCLFESFGPEFAPITHAYSLSIFLTQTEVCPGRSFVALQPGAPGPRSI